MRQKLLVGCVVILASITLSNAQNLWSPDSLNFLPTMDTSSSTQILPLYNPSSKAIFVLDIDFFDLYADKPFAVQDTAFTVLPQDTYKVAVTFRPEHNVYHNMALVVRTNSGFGSLSIALAAQGVFSNSYYATTQNLTEQALKVALKARLGQGYNSLGYNTARDNMFMSIDNQKNNGQGASVNTLECIYTGTQITGYANRSAAQNGSPAFNTEHTYPQGKFNSNEPMKSDIHHLFPTTNSSNSERGNKPFGNVGSASWTVGGSKSNSSTFEPRDSQKGASARAMMYFVLRYQDYSSFFKNQETVLRNWHDQFPPDAIDSARNEDIFSLQNNRNPFVDYPQFVERITSLVSATPAPIVQSIYSSEDTISLGIGNGRHTYSYVVYNNGNSPVVLSGFALSDTSLHFVSGNPGAITLAPQTFQNIQISFSAAANYFDTLSYTTDVNGTTTYTIPVISGVPLSLTQTATTHINVYPNPTNGRFKLEVDPDHVSKLLLYDVHGKSYAVKMNANQIIDVSHLASGVYWLKVQTRNNEYATIKIVKQP